MGKKVAFYYKRARPLVLSCSVRGDVVAWLTVRMGTAEGTLEKHYEKLGPVAVTHALPARLPLVVSMEYEVKGPAGSPFLIKSQIVQGGRKRVITSDLAIPAAGSATLTISLFPKRGRAAGDWAPQQVVSLLDQVEHFFRFGIPADTDLLFSFSSLSANMASGLHWPWRSREKVARPEGKAGRMYKVWYGTNRTPIFASEQIVAFSAHRDHTCHVGSCDVYIPETHAIGSTGSSGISRLLNHVAGKDDRLRLSRIESISDEAAYCEALSSALRLMPTGKRQAVVFIHGFNVSFEAAAIRTAQLGCDLNVQGAMAFFSWPSQARLRNYLADEAAIEASEGFIADYLTAIAEQTAAERVHVIAHSMGNRGLLRAIQRISMTASKRTSIPFAQIVLAAADVDQDTFRGLAVTYKTVAERTTMYICARDRAVEASHWLHSYPRAGLAPPVVVVPGIDTIQVSNLDLTILAHGYVAEARDVLQDIHRILHEGTPPDSRFGIRKEATPEGATYWSFAR